jgi:hypothetical protein
VNAGGNQEAISKRTVIPKPPRLRSGQAPAEESAFSGESAFCLIQKQIPREVYPRRGLGMTIIDIFILQYALSK